jgi:hypothetical protein
MILEGSPADIRAAMSDTALIASAVEAKMKGDAAVDTMKRMKEKVESFKENSLSEKDKKELADLRKDAIECKAHLGAHKAALAAAEAKVAQLKAELENPIHLSPEQEAQLEAVFQSELAVMREPPVFPIPGGHKLTSDQILERVFGLLARGDRLHAIKMIREVSGIKLNEGRDLIDGALRAFGCNTGHNGVPTPPKVEVIALPENMPRNPLLQIEEKKT